MDNSCLRCSSRFSLSNTVDGLAPALMFWGKQTAPSDAGGLDTSGSTHAGFDSYPVTPQSAICERIAPSYILLWESTLLRVTLASFSQSAIDHL